MPASVEPTPKTDSSQAGPKPAEILYLIDGHGQIFRSFYAIRGGMSSPVTGEPTNALFAFAGMLLKLFHQFHPHYVAMAIDTPGPTFREELYPQYKSQREAPPEELIQQIPRIFEMTRLFGIPLLGKSGAEADDVIATVTQRVLDDPALAGVQLRLVSKDKDLEQLLGPRVSMFDIHTDTLIDTDWLRANKGIRPEQVVDVLALSGDTVDNIPGVAGIGPKTAAKLVHDFGSIDGVLSHLDQLRGKQKENLEKARGFLPLSRRLVTLKRDVDIPFRLEDARVGRIDGTRLRQLFRELGFRKHAPDLERLLEWQASHPPEPGSGPVANSTPAAPLASGSFAESLFDGGPAPAPAPRVHEFAVAPAALATAAGCRYTAVTTADQLDELVRTLRVQKMVAIDTETIGLGRRAALCGLSFSWEPRAGVYVPVRSPNPSEHLSEQAVLAALGPLLEDPALPKCGHNLKYDLHVLRNAGVRVRGVAFDSLIASHLVGTLEHSLDDLAQSHLQHEMIPISRLIGQGGRGQPQKTMDQVPLAEVVVYAAEDADIALRLYELFSPQLSAMGLQRLAAEVEMPLVEVLTEMEHQGVRIDAAVLTQQKQDLAERAGRLRQQIEDLVGYPFNLDSPRQLAEVLFKKLGLPVVKRTKTGPSTDNEVLEALCNREDLTPQQTAVPRLIVDYRQLTKLLSTYLDNLRDSIDPATGRVHATFHQTGAATGRLSSSDPNLQNIPIRSEVGRQIRKAFVAEPGNSLISADYSQVELRLLAHLSGDPLLIDAFEKDMDIHAAVAAQVFGVDPEHVTPEQRSQAKMINFGIVYGITAHGLSRRVEQLSLQGAKDLIADYRRRFAGIDAFLSKCVQQAMDLGYVTTMLGRRRPVPQVKSPNANTRNLGQRLAINSVVQGSAADLIKLAMVNLYRRIEREGLAMKLLLQVHDELVLEAPAGAASRMAVIVREEMQSAMRLRVPLKVDVGVGPNWMETR